MSNVNVTVADIKQMDERQAYVQKKLEEAEAKMRQTGLLAAAATFLPGAAVLNWALGSEVAANTSGDVEMARTNFGKWTGEMRRWAERGTNDYGVAYPVAEWLKFGEQLGKHLAELAGTFFDTSLFAITTKTVDATAATVKQGVEDAANKAKKVITEPWSTSVKVALWGLGLTGSAAVAAYLLSQVNAIALPFLPKRSPA